MVDGIRKTCGVISGVLPHFFHHRELVDGIWEKMCGVISGVVPHFCFTTVSWLTGYGKYAA